MRKPTGLSIPSKSAKKSAILPFIYEKFLEIHNVLKEFNEKGDVELELN